jgi:hypothetical protein
MVGAGRVPGQEIVMLRASALIVASTVPPPPDSVSGSAETVGEYVPSEFSCRSAFSGVHAPSTKDCTGSEDSVAVRLPSGFAVVVDVSVLSAVATTGFPVDSASVSASCAVSGDESVAACVARDGAAGRAVVADAGAAARPMTRNAAAVAARNACDLT